MGFFARKRFKIAPGIYLNASKNGLGVSVGIKGLRISHNTKGQTFLNAGRYGLYYRERLNKNNNKIQEGFENADKGICSGFLSYLHLLKEVKGNFDFAVFEPSEYILEELMAFHRVKDRIFKYLQIILFIIGCFFHWIWIFNILLILWLEKTKKEFILNPNEDIIKDLRNCLRTISDDYIMHNARTNEELQYGGLEVKNLFSCNVPFINLNYYKMCFIDTGILFYSNKIVFLIPYEKFDITLSETTALMIYPPKYAKIVSTTYEHVNKDGSPNKRYKTNHEINEISAYVITLKFEEDIIIPLVLFDEEKTKEIYNSLKQIQKSSIS